MKKIKLTLQYSAIILSASLLTANKGCQENYELAPGAGTTPTSTATPTATATPTPTPSVEIASVLSEVKKLGQEDSDNSNLLKIEASADKFHNAKDVAKNSNWLGNIYNDEIADMAKDSDQDGFSDNLENDFDSDPNNKLSVPQADPITQLAARFTEQDDDRDGVLNTEEVALSLNPKRADSDNDGFNDGLEILSKSNPKDLQSYPADLDGDGLSTDYENQHNIDPTNKDSDSDGLNDGYEIEISSNPSSNDSDHDGILDGKEVELGSDPTIAESNLN